MADVALCHYARGGGRGFLGVGEDEVGGCRLGWGVNGVWELGGGGGPAGQSA